MGKRIVVRRRKVADGDDANAAATVKAGGKGSHSKDGTPARKVIVAHRIRAGETIKLGGQNVTMQERRSEVQAVPQSLATGDWHGPQRDEDGRVLERAVLGSTAQFDDFAKRMKENQRMVMQASGGHHRRSVADMQRQMDAEEAELLNDEKSNVIVDESGKIIDLSREAKLARAQRREDKRRAKALRAMSYNERLALTRNERSLAKWRAANKQWDKFKKNMARKLGKDPNLLVISSTDDYRAKVEEYDLLLKATPLHERYGAEFWRMNLRDKCTTYVPVGNVFSGLYCEVNETEKPAMETIRRPNNLRVRGGGYGDDDDDDDEGLDTIASLRGGGAGGAFGSKGGRRTMGLGATRSWKDSRFLKQRRKRLQKTINRMLPNGGTGPDLDTMVIRGTDLFAKDDDDDDDDESGYGSNTYDSGDEHDGDDEKEEEPASGKGAQKKQALQPMKVEVLPDSRYPGGAPQMERRASNLPSLLLRRGSIVNEKKDNKKIKHVQGPSVVLSHTRLVFHCGTGETCTNQLVLTNNGSTSLAYEWHPKTANGSAGLFTCAGAKGMLTPGEAIRIVFNFSPEDPGVYLDEMALYTAPALGQGIPELSLKGLCVMADRKKVLRSELEEEISKLQAKHIAEDMVTHVVKQVQPPPPPVEDHRKLFYRYNRDIQLFYYEDSFKGFQKLYEDTLALHKRAIRRTHMWDFSARNLRSFITEIPSRHAKQIPVLLGRWQKLRDRAAVRPAPHPDLYTAMNTLITDCTSQISRLAYVKRAALGLPATASADAGTPNAEDDAKTDEQLAEEHAALDAKETEFKAHMHEEVQKLMMRGLKQFGELTRAQEDGDAGPLVDFVKRARDVEAEPICRVATWGNGRSFPTPDPFAKPSTGDDGGKKKRAKRESKADKAAREAREAAAREAAVLDKYDLRLAALADTHALAMTKDRRVFSWPTTVELEDPAAKAGGKGAKGKKGAPEPEPEEPEETDPAKMPLPAFQHQPALQGLQITQLVAGPNVNYAITRDAELLSWSQDAPAQMNVVQMPALPKEQGEEEEQAAVGEDGEDATIEPEPLNLPGVVSVACSQGETPWCAAVDTEGRLLTWGMNGKGGYLGHNDKNGDRESPEPIESVAEIKFSAVSCGHAHSLALSADGQVYSWGEAALGAADKARAAPTLIEGLGGEEDPVVQICAGSNHSLARTVSGKVYAWGASPAVGLGEEVDADTPTLLEAFNTDDQSNSVVDIASGSEHSVAVDSAGRVWVWGAPAHGVLGTGSAKEPKFTPTQVQALAGQQVSRAYAGGPHTAVLIARPEEDEDEDA